MKNRIASFGVCLLGCVLGLLTLARSNAQEAFRPTDVNLADVSGLLTHGIELETQQRWGEALTHYEAASRRHPSNEQLKSRMLMARMHFDLSRRYSDASYRDLVRQLSEQDTLDLVGEVLLKIQSHYVHEPNWSELLARGADSLRIALHDEDFLRAHSRDVSFEQVEKVTEHIAQTLATRHIKDRHQTLEMIRWIGRWTEKQIHIPANPIILECMCGMAGSLDAYSTFLTATQLDEVFSQIEGNFVGLGVELKAEDGVLHIAHVIPQGPAYRAGLRAGERIVAVDGRLTAEVSADVAADLLRGEEGTSVEVTLETPDAQRRAVRVKRERVEVPSVEEISMIDPAAGVGYFRISSFQKTTSRDVDAALWKLHREGMRSLIVDVRGNPGGLLNEAVEVADRFLQEGTIVATHGRSARENYDYKAHRVGTWRMPLVVLIDGDSASASEIFAGAIHDHQRGTIVGDRSYGKGSVQGIFPLRVARGGVRLTTAKFYSPSGKAISQGGVEPDLAVHSASKPVTQGNSQLADSDDVVLEAGKRVARKLIARRDEPTDEVASQPTRPGNGNSSSNPSRARTTSVGSW